MTVIAAMVLSAIVPWVGSSALAFSGGNGSTESPYKISTCSDLVEIANDLGSNYELANSINCDGQTVAPIGSEGSPFIGSLDGKGYTISNITYVENASKMGIFGVTDGATITNMFLDNIYYGGQTDIGLVVGYASSTTISKIGVMNSTVEGTSLHTGALVGYLGGSTIEKSYAVNTTVTGGAIVGGLVGKAVGPSGVGNSYFQGTVNANVEVGGITGGAGPGPAYVQKSYADVIFTAAGSDVVGTVGGGAWTSDNFIASNPYRGNHTEPPLDNWDFDLVWVVRANAYPTLRWSTNLADLNGDNVIDADQPNVGGYTNSYSGKTVAIDVGAECTLTSDDSTSEANLGVQDSAYDYANGLWDFEADCGEQAGITTTIKLYYYDADPTGLVVRKFNPNTNAYFTITSASIGQQTIGGHNVVVATYTIQDGGELDMDGLANGVIQDPAGIAALVVAVPNTGIGGRSQ